MTTDYPKEEGWFVVANARVLHYFKERRLLSPCMRYNRTQIILGPQELKEDQRLCKVCSSEIKKRYWNLDEKGTELLYVVGE